MTRPTTPPILSELRSSTSAASQVAALRALKHDIIGNEQKKRMWVGLGVLVPLARILNIPKGSGKQQDLQGNGTALPCRSSFVRTDDEEARLQAIIIVGSLAHDGLTYLSSIRANAVVASLLLLLSTVNSSATTVLAILRTLNTIADASSLLELDTKDQERGLFHRLYTEEFLDTFAQILSQKSDTYSGQQQISLAATLIAKTCGHESQRNLLARTQVLQALASRLATFIFATDYLCGPSPGSLLLFEYLNAPSSLARPQLAAILGAIGVIIHTSRFRALQFLSCPVLTVALLKLEAEMVVPSERKTDSRSHLGTGSFTARFSSSCRLEHLLPQLPNSFSKGSLSESTGHPQLGAAISSGRQPHSTRALQHAHEVIRGHSDDLSQEEENTLIAWLIHLVRVSSGLTRQMAAWLLSLLHGSGLVDKRRDMDFAMLLIPLLVRLLDNEPTSAAEDQSAYGVNPLQPTNLTSQQQAASIMATLMVDNLESQRAAFDAGAIKKLAQILKESYNPALKESKVSQWTPEPLLADESYGSNDSLRIHDTRHRKFVHSLAKVREAVLTALASLASVRDDYRKTIIDNGVVPFVIESLKPYHSPRLDGMSDDTASEDHQDPSSQTLTPSGVILAACAATRSLSRSVTTLRTSLMDAGVTAPLFILLKHHDINVQIAATTVISNLVLEFSPMREAILEAGVLKTLCDHARSMDPKLRLSSIWALKHLIVSAPKDLKRECLAALGPGWLKQIICQDVDDSLNMPGARFDRETSLGTPLAMGTPNAAGEQVDLLNATDGIRDGIHVSNQEDEEDSKMIDSVGLLNFPQLDFEPRVQHQHTRRISGRRDVTGAGSQSRADDLAVQKEGLDFIRNLICGNDSVDMIDCLFEELGQDKMFDMLTSKLRPRLSNAFNRDRRSSENNVRQSAPQADVVTSVCYIVVHLAAGRPRHRQLLISQSELLKLILPFCEHPNSQVRVACAWIVINLTWMDDQSDQPSCRERANRLRELGWYEQLQVLESDPELDVRERVKTALHQINCAIR